MSVQSKLRNLLTLFLVFQYVLATNRCISPNDDKEIGKRLPVSPFAVFNEMGLQMCFRECEAYAMCLSINFSPKMLMCELNSQRKSETLALVNNSDFIYKEIPNIIDYRDKKCGITSCSYHSKCVRTKLDKYVCIEIVHGGWSGWDAWGSCSVNCGGGTRSRTRRCDNPTPMYGGQTCSGQSLDSLSCNMHNCPVHGGWSGWQRWGGCSVTCGGGTRLRTRSCNNPTPMYGGQSCSGQSSDSSSCNTHNCPVHGGWSGWYGWGGCSVNCGVGTRSRTRSCNNPTPMYGGQSCSGQSSDSSSCNAYNCPVDGGWGGWDEWDQCTGTCVQMNRYRYRSCDNPRPEYNGNHCSGDSSEFSRCYTCNDIRIVNGPSYTAGRVEIKYNGVWGTVCDDIWGDNHATVVCRMLGFSGNAIANSSASFGEGEGQIWLDDVQCNGKESHIFDCQHLPFGEHNCGHHEDASVICS